MPNPDYKAHAGKQGTWEVSYRGSHVAKRSFLKHGGEDSAAKHVLWAAWCHHTHRTGQPCQLPWLLEEFGIGAVAEDVAAQALDATALADLGEPRKRKRAGKNPSSSSGGGRAPAETAAGDRPRAGNPSSSSKGGGAPGDVLDAAAAASGTPGVGGALPEESRGGACPGRGGGRRGQGRGRGQGRAARKSRAIKPATAAAMEAAEAAAAALAASAVGAGAATGPAAAAAEQSSGPSSSSSSSDSDSS